MIRKIIKIDEEKCNGCGLCADACHEGAIEIVDGKAKLVRENFCDGFGDCLPGCPTGAITFEEREAPEYDEAAVQEAKVKKMDEMKQAHHESGCPGSRMMQFEQKDEETPVALNRPVSRLGQWPCQIQLVPTQAPFFEGAKLLIAADCTAYAYANMHEDFMKGKITIIGCPKLDYVGIRKTNSFDASKPAGSPDTGVGGSAAVDYTEKLTAIIRDNEIMSVTIVRMEVPCCGGLQRAAENALKESGKFIPWQVVTVSRDGKILD